MLVSAVDVHIVVRISVLYQKLVNLMVQNVELYFMLHMDGDRWAVMLRDSNYVHYPAGYLILTVENMPS